MRPPIIAGTVREGFTLPSKQALKINDLRSSLRTSCYRHVSQLLEEEKVDQAACHK